MNHFENLAQHFQWMDEMLKCLQVFNIAQGQTSLKLAKQICNEPSLMVWHRKERHRTREILFFARLVIILWLLFYNNNNNIEEGVEEEEEEGF